MKIKVFPGELLEGVLYIWCGDVLLISDLVSPEKREEIINNRL